MATQRRLLDSITENDPWIVITAEADSRTYAQRGGHTRKKRAPGEHEQSSTAGLVRPPPPKNEDEAPPYGALMAASVEAG